jgi:hypoxanthine phosphoribosyltransferase
MDPKQKQAAVMLSTEVVQKRVAEMAAQISADYAGQELTVVGVLKGSFIFMADLVRAIDLPLRCDFLGLSSYGSATESSGVVAITKDLDGPVADRHVLVIEDIIDTGLTMAYLLKNLSTRKPKSVKIASLLSKPARRQIEVKIDYLGFTIEDRFVVGYGLDFDGRYRNLPFIGTMD